MDFYDKELISLLAAFQKFEVKYIIVGGFTTNYHGYMRATGDIDFWIKDDLENRKKIIEAFDYIKFGRFEELLSVPLIPGYCDIYISNGIYADLLDSIHGFGQDDFDRCYSDSQLIELKDVELRFLSYPDHLHSKSQSNRLKDQLDVQELKKIHEEE